MKLRWRIACLSSAALIAVALSGCGGSTAGQSGAPTATVTATVTATQSASPTASPSAKTPPSSALQLAQELKANGLPMSRVVKQDENNDPNDLIGRPNEYDQRVSFDYPGGDKSADKYDTQRGGVIERWGSQAAATKRKSYIQGILTSAPALGAEYDYVVGRYLVRIAGTVKPSVAKKIRAALIAVAGTASTA